MLSNDVIQSLPVTRSYTGIMTNIASLMPTGGVGAEKTRVRSTASRRMEAARTKDASPSTACW